LIERQPFQLAVIQLAHSVLDQHRQIMRSADALGGLPRALKTAGIDGADSFVAQPLGSLFGLADADVTEVAIARALAAALKIPVRRAVAHQDDLHFRCLRLKRA